jgi:transposase
MPADPSDDKAKALRRTGTLNPGADEVADDLFKESEFFDARDLVQVKYEMLRRVEHDGWTIIHSADAFGFSRPTFYQTKEAFEEDGLWGLVPERRGPRGPHKLTEEILAYVGERRAAEPSLGWAELAEIIEARFGLRVHPRTVQRHLMPRQKKR